MPGSILNGCTTAGSISSDNAPTVNVPAGAGAGDAYVLLLMLNPSETQVVTWPSGFTPVPQAPFENSYGSRIRVAVRPYDGTEGAQFVASTSEYAFWGALCGVIDGISAATIVDSDSAGSYAGFVTDVSLPSGTVTVPGSGYVCIWCGASAAVDTAAPTALTPPSGFSTPTGGAIELYGDYTLHLAYQGGLNAGDVSPVGTHSWAAGSARSALGISFLLQESGGDTTGPTLSAPTGTATGPTTATVGATTNEGNGTLYGVVTTSATQPSIAQIKAGQDHTGAAAPWDDTQAVSSTGAKTFNAVGLTAATAYYAHFVHTDAAANDSNRVSSASFTTADPPQFLRPSSTVSPGTWQPSTGGSITALLDETVYDDGDFVYTSAAGDVLVVAVTAGADPAVNTGHIVRYRLRGDGTSGVQVELLQGTTQIATWTHDPAPSSFTSYEQTLSGGQADSITDYAALRLRFTEV